MKTWILALAFLGLAPLSGWAVAPSPAEAPLTLAEAIAQALNTNPRLEIARSGVSAARAGRHAARAAGLPNVDLNAAGRIQGPEVTILQPQLAPGSSGGTPQIVGVQTRTQSPSRIAEADVRAIQPLYTGGRIAAERRSAQRGERAALAREEAEAQRLVVDVTEAYLGVLEARQQVQLAGAARSLNEERLRVAQVRLAANAGILLEATQAESDLAQEVQREIEAQARLRQAGATLNTLIGRGAGAPLVLADLPATEPRHELLSPTSALPAPERLQELGLERPELRALREEVRWAEAQVDAARAGRRPQLNLTGSYLRRTPVTLAGSFAWTLGGSLVQSLFNGGRVRARVEQARAEQVRSAATLAQAERQAAEQIEQAQAALEAAEKRLASEDRRVAAAVAGVDVARVRRQAGTAAPIEVTEAETVLVRAQTGATTARFDAARARVRLALVVGLAYPETIRDLAAAPAAR